MTATTTTVVGTAAGTALFAARIVATRVAGSPAALAVVFLVIFVFLVFIGLFFAMAALVAWMQKVAQKYLALKELQVLTGEYMVKDLSELEKQYSNGQDLEQGNVGPSAHRAPMWVPMMPQEVQINLYRDLQAVQLGLRSAWTLIKSPIVCTIHCKGANVQSCAYVVAELMS